MASVPLFIASNSRVAAQLPKLHEIANRDGDTTYIEPVTQERWTKLQLWDYHGSGPTVLRRGTPTAEDLVARIAETTFPDEAAAAAYYLANWIKDGFEYFESLLTRLELLARSTKTSTSSRSIGLAIVWSGMQEPRNHRQIMGKSAAEIEADYQYFCALAERARKLAAEMERFLGHEIKNDSSVFR
jgi:hypothetical protein